jgi:hypothetical protein
MEQTLVRMHSELGDLRAAAVELQSRASPIKECAQVQAPAASASAASAQCDADLTRALVRADTAERDLKELKAKVRDASRAWKASSYDSAFEMMERLDE